jgi:hypothetical protein
MGSKHRSVAPAAAPAEIDTKELEALSKRLLAFARRHASTMSWWLGNGGALAKGYTVEDVVCKALMSLFVETEVERAEGTRRRRWDREKYPDPWIYLVLFVKTELRNLSVSSENKSCARDLDEDSLQTNETPEALLLEAEADADQAKRVARTYALLIDEVGNDKDLLAIHDLMMNEDIRKPAVLAERLSMSIKDVNNLKRRLSCIGIRIMARLEGGGIQ